MKKLVCSVILVCLMLSLAACDSGLRVVSISIDRFPNKITYVAGQDSELDMSGCNIRRTTKSGIEDVLSVTSEGYTIRTGIKSTELELIEFDGSKAFEIHHNIDFNVPGVYQVNIILLSGIACSFAIEVIDLDRFCPPQ